MGRKKNWNLYFHSIMVSASLLALVHCGSLEGLGNDEENLTTTHQNLGTKERSATRDRVPDPETQDTPAPSDNQIPEVRSIDGSGNNQVHPLWGSTGVRLERLASATYFDGISEPAGADRPNPRQISNEIVAQDGDIPNERGLSAFTFIWGQFLDHDLDLSLVDVTDSFPIEVPLGDPFFDPEETGAELIGFSRSVFDASSGTGVENPREQTNTLTAWIDASQVYGSDADRAAWLRTGVDGKLKTSDGDLLPFNDGTQANAPSTGSEFFVAGDLRVNEQVGLMVIQTLFVREHNRLAAEIKQKHPAWSDEQIYQQARRWVGAFMQSITFNEFLPALLGPYAPGRYRGYDPGTNPNILNEFSTAFFRVGHTMLTAELLLLDGEGQSLAGGNLALQEAFFNSGLLTEIGIDPLLRGMAFQPMQEVDSHIVDGVRNFLFGPPGSGGLDLASLNLQRGRDHGLPDYNTLRQALGLQPIEDFSELNADPAIQEAFEKTYASVDHIDSWIGALSEDHLAGASVGSLLKAAFLTQFEALRHGDRFWFEHDPAFRREDIEIIRATKLSDLIRRNTQITNIPEYVFRVPR